MLGTQSKSVFSNKNKISISLMAITRDCNVLKYVTNFDTNGTFDMHASVHSQSTPPTNHVKRVSRNENKNYLDTKLSTSLYKLSC